MNGINVAFIGFGTVGKGVYETIHSHQKQLHDITGKKVEVTTIVIQNPNKHQNIKKDIHITTDIQHIINNPAIDVVFEAIVGVEPAYLHIKNCIKAGKHMITANKEMFATHGQELKLLAEHYGVALGFDATTDRKSTRLNSSHVAISYAVFCLNKKTTCMTAIETV